jgi:hypothetical protein
MTRVTPSFLTPFTETTHSPQAVVHQTSNKSTLSSASNQGYTLLSPIYAVADFVTWLLQTIFCCFDYSERGRLRREFATFKESILDARDKCAPSIDTLYEDRYKKLDPVVQKALQNCASKLLAKQLEKRPQLKETSTAWQDKDAAEIAGQLDDLGVRFAQSAFNSTQPELAGLVNPPHNAGASSNPPTYYEDHAYALVLKLFAAVEKQLEK